MGRLILSVLLSATILSVAGVGRAQYDRVPDHRVRSVLVALETEEDEKIIEHHLSVLGRSGRLEALGVIQTHAVSPFALLREAGRSALTTWLMVNRVIASPRELPKPPHAYYSSVPDGIADDMPARRALGATALPQYRPPNPDGVPRGFAIEGRPHMRLVIGGAATLGGLYLATSIGGTAAMGEHTNPALWIPIVGPFIPAIEAFASDDGPAGIDGLSKFGALFLMLGGVGQITGGIILAVGLGTSKDELVRKEHADARVPEVRISPNGASARWTF